MSEIRKGLNVVSNDVIIKTFIDDISSNQNLNLGSGYDSNNSISYPITLSHLTSTGEKKAVCVKEGLVGIDTEAPKSKLHIDKTYWGLDDFTSNNKPVSIINKHTCITNQNGYYKIAQITKPTGHELQAGLNIKGTIVNNDIKFDNGNDIPPFGFNASNFMQFDITIMMTSANVNSGEEPNMYMIGTVNGSAYASPTSPGNPGSGADIIVSTNSSTLGETIPKAVILYLPSGVVCNLEITGVGFFQDNTVDSCQLDYDGNRNVAITDCYADFQSPYSLQLSDKNKNDIVFNTPIGLGIRENYPYSTLAVNGNVSIGSGFSAAGTTQDKEGSTDLIEHSTSHNNGLIVEGNVGIGVNTPLNKLQVMGNLTLGDGPGTFVGFNTYYDTDWKFVDTQGLVGGVTAYNKEGWVIQQVQTGSNPDVPNNRLDINRVFTNNGGNIQKTPVITIKASQQNLSNAILPNGEVKTDDASANFIGINTTTPSCILDISGTDALKIPCGSNEERPEINVKAVEGMIRYNTTEMQFQGYSYDSFNPTSGSWKGLGGVIDVDQNTLIVAETGPTTDEDQLRFFTSARTGDATNAVNDAFQTDRKLQMIIHNTTGGVAIGNTYATDVGNSHGNVPASLDYTIGSGYYAPPENGLLVEGDVGIGTNNPSCMLDVSGTNALKIPCGNNSQRPTAGGTAVEGMIRYNTEELQFQGYSYDSFNPTTGTWKGLGGVIDVDQDTKIIAEISATNDDDQLQFHTASGYVDNVYYFTVTNLGSFGNRYFVSSSDNQSVSFYNNSGNFTTSYGTQHPVLTLYKGKTYRFDYSHSSAQGTHPLRISNALDSSNKPTSMSATEFGEYQISTSNFYIDWTPTVNGNYYYGCGSHGGMAGTGSNIIVQDEPAISGTIKMVLDNTNGGLAIGNTYSTEVTNSEISGAQLGLKKNKPPKDGLLVEGKVGIGVRQPMEALEINGNITKHGLVRPAGWGGGVTHYDFYSDGGSFGGGKPGGGTGDTYFKVTHGRAYFYENIFIGDSFYNTTAKSPSPQQFSSNKALLALATSSASEDASIVLSTLHSNKKSMLKLTSAATGITTTDQTASGKVDSNASGLELSLSDEAYLKTNGTYNLNLGVGNFQHLRINSDGNGIEMFNQYVGTTSQTSIPNVTTCTTLQASPGGCLSINGFINCHALMNRGETLQNATGIVFGTGPTDTQAVNSFGYGPDQISFVTNGLRRLHVASGGTVTIDPSLVVNGASTFNNTVTSTHQIEGLSFNATSDARYKENVTDLSNALEKITSIRGVNFNFIGESKKHGGIIAQEVEKVIPEAINKENDDKWSANYNTLIGYLIESVKELKKENDELKEELSSKTEVISKMHSDISIIKEMLKLKI